jgi:hypothetical protein
MQVGAHDIVDLIHIHAGGSQAALKAIAVHHMPEGPARPGLVIPDTTVNENIVMGRLDEIALNAEHKLSSRHVHTLRLQPAAVLIQHLIGQCWEKFLHIEEWRFLLDYAMDRDVTD